ncbi:MAG: NAD(P)H-dependent oxidoreductase [Desulfobacteraceae bacterium]|nr:NAD(P)H-dependent oxidoreductase [Desulfobacteraceae bacterium]
MNNLIIYAHPYGKSYNASILEHLTNKLREAKQSVDVIDLYKEEFNPVLNEKELALYSQGKFLDPMVEDYQKRINNADHLFFIFPVWWYDIPAILKGFIDKVFLKNWAYEISEKGIPKGKLTFIKKVSIISTMKSPKWYYWLLYRNSIKHSFIKGTLKFCGIKNIQWVNITNIENMGDLKRKQWLKRIRQVVS